MVCVAGGCVRGRGGMHGRGLCGRGYVWQGACVAGGHAWQGCVWQGACMVGVCMAGGHARQILRDMVNERAVCILLECILVPIFLLNFTKTN